jgi:hypothetical protein
MAAGSKDSKKDVGRCCSPEQGGGEAGGVTGAEEVYGPYAGAIREGVASCADCLGRIGRQLEGVPSRHYVAEKAHALRDAAGRLIGLCHDVEGWLRFCGEPVRDRDGEWSGECVQEAGHLGAHAAEVARSALEVARDSAEAVAGSAVAVSDHLGWIAYDPARLGDPYEAAVLMRSYGALRRSVEGLSPTLAALRAETLVCSECEFQAESIGHLQEHKQEAGH